MAAAEWDPQRLKAIARWYGAQRDPDPSAPGCEDEVLELDPASNKGQILHTIQYLLENEVDAQSAAESLASLVLSDSDSYGLWG